MILRREIGDSHVYFGGSIEAGNAWDDTNEFFPKQLIYAGSVYVAARTPLGPLHLALGAAKGGNVTIYVYLGQVFFP